MSGLELLKTAINEGVKVLPKNFLKSNGFQTKYLGSRCGLGVIDTPEEIGVYVIETGEFKDEVFYEWV